MYCSICVLYFNKISNKTSYSKFLWDNILVPYQHTGAQHLKKVPQPVSSCSLISRAQKSETCSAGAKNSPSLTVTPPIPIWQLHSHHFVFQVGERPSGQMAQWLTQHFEPPGHLYLHLFFKSYFIVSQTFIRGLWWCQRPTWITSFSYHLQTCHWLNA